MPRRSLVLVAGAVVALLVAAVAALLAGRDASSGDYCAEAEELAAANVSGVLGQFDLDDPDANAVAMRETVTALRQLQAAAPDAVAGDAATVAERTADIVDALAELETDPARARDRLDELALAYDEFTEASARLTADVRDRCGVSLDGQPVATTTTLPADPATTAPG